MSHQLTDAIDHINRQDAIPCEGKHTCVCCGDSFDIGGECNQYSGDKICNECLTFSRYIIHYQEQGELTDLQILELTFKQL